MDVAAEIHMKDILKFVEMCNITFVFHPYLMNITNNKQVPVEKDIDTNSYCYPLLNLKEPPLTDAQQNWYILDLLYNQSKSHLNFVII